MNKESKTAILSYRVSPTRKRITEESAKRIGMSTSDYIDSCVAQHEDKLFDYRDSKLFSIIVRTSNAFDSFINELINSDMQMFDKNMIIDRVSAIFREEDKIWHR